MAWRDKSEELNCTETTWGVESEGPHGQECSWRKRGLPWKWSTIVESYTRDRATITDSLPTCQPLPPQGLGRTPTRASTPHSVATSCWCLLLQALERDPIRVSVPVPVVATLSLPGLSKQVCLSHLLHSPPLTWVGNRLLWVSHKKSWGQNQNWAPGAVRLRYGNLSMQLHKLEIKSQWSAW